MTCQYNNDGTELLLSWRLGEGEVDKMTTGPTEKDSASSPAMPSALVDRAQMEKSLQETNNYLESLLNHANAPIIVWDVDYRITRFNHAFERLIGRSAAEVIGQQMNLLFPEGSRQQSLDFIRATTGKHWETVEIKLAHRDGSELVLLWNSATVYTEDGKTVVATIAQGQDITERKLLEDTQAFLAYCGLRQDKDFFRLLAEFLAKKLGMFYVCIDRLVGDGLHAETVAVYCDDKFEDNVRYALQDTPCGVLAGQQYCIFPRQVRALFPRDLALQELAAESYVGTTLRSFDDQPIGLIAIIGRQPMDSPRFAELVLKLVGLRAAAELERRQAEAGRQETQERYQALLMQSHDAVALVDLKTLELVEANPRFEQLTGYRLQDRPCLGLVDLFDDSQVNIMRYLDQLHSSGVLPPTLRNIKSKDGRRLQAERSGSLICSGGRCYMLLTLRDVTQEMQRQRDLQKDLLLATQVQRALLPPIPRSEFFRLETLFRPQGFVSGDVYHLEWQKPQRLLRGFLVDITGHGLATALQTAAVNVLLHEVLDLPGKLSVAEQLSWLNRRIAGYIDETSFAAAIAFELDFAAAELRYAVAGITDFLFNAQRITAPGLMLGINEHETYETNTLPLVPGDSVCFITDGISDVLTAEQSWGNVDAARICGRFADAEQAAKLKDDATAIYILVQRSD